MSANVIEFGLGYDLTGLKNGGAEAQSMVKRTMSGLSQSIGAAGAGLPGLSSFFGGAAIAGGAASIINFADKITDLSSAAGLSTDQFQQWSFALEQNGAKQEDLVKTMGALIGKTEDALGGNELAIASFQKMGVSVSDLAQRNPSQILLKMADALKQGGADGQTTAAMMDVLGSKLALKLVPSLKDGSEAFLQLGRSATVASADAIAAAGALNDRWDRVMRDMKTKLLNQGFGIADSRMGVQGRGGYADETTPAATAADLADTRSRGARGKGRDSGAFFGPDKPKPAGSPEQDRLLDERRHIYEDIAKIQERIYETNLDSSRAGMNTAELIASFQKEGAQLAERRALYENDYLDSSIRQTAELKLQEAIINSRVQALQREMIMMQGRDTGQQFGPGRAEFDRSRHGPTTQDWAFNSGAGGLGHAALQVSRGLHGSGGLSTGAQELIRRGDAERAKHPDAEHSKAIAENTRQIKQAMQDAWGK